MHQSPTLPSGAYAVALAVAIAGTLGLSACNPSTAQQTPVAAGTPVQQAAAPTVPPQQVAVAPQATAPQAMPPQNGQPVPMVAAPAPQPAPGYAPAPTYAQPAPNYAPAPVQRAAVPVAPLARVVSISPIHERPHTSGAGAVIGGVLGAVVGNQFGHGNGRAAMTVLGAGGGAYAGNTVEGRVNDRVVGYRVQVQMDNGSTRSYDETNLGGLRVGDRVRVEGHRLRAV